jgi:hypothetical protein
MLKIETPCYAIQFKNKESVKFIVTFLKVLSRKINYSLKVKIFVKEVPETSKAKN